MKKLTKVVLLENLTDKVGRKYDALELMSQTYNKTFHGEILDASSGLSVNMKNITHYVDNITIINNNLIGDITILDTPLGNAVQVLLSNGIKISTSIRAIGEVNNNHMVSNLVVTTFDLDIKR
jgi:hypothetical protein